jgi:rhodanese-related sulfurtransferase
MKSENALRGLFIILLLSALAVAMAGCTDVTYNIDNSQTAPPVVTVDQFDTVREALDTYLSAGTPPTITAAALFDVLNDGDTSNDPVVVSVRSNEHYQLGHVPGAINIPWKEIAEPANLAMITTGKDVVCYCYTGHTGAIAATVLNALGYDAQNMKFGMVDWTKDPDVRATTPFTEATDAHDFPLETAANTLPPINGFPEIDNTTSQDTFEIVRAAAESYVAGTQPPVTTAQALFDNLNDGDTSNDPLIISVRSAEHYDLGHIPGAINIPWRNIAQEASLKQIPPDAEIVCYCYTGHTGGVATTALNMLGYDALNLKWGILSWTTDPDVRVATPFSEDTSNDFAYNTGPNP